MMARLEYKTSFFEDFLMGFLRRIRISSENKTIISITLKNKQIMSTRY